MKKTIIVLSTIFLSFFYFNTEVNAEEEIKVDNDFIMFIEDVVDDSSTLLVMSEMEVDLTSVFLEVVDTYYEVNDFQSIYDYYLNNKLTLTHQIDDIELFGRESYENLITPANIGGQTVRETFEVRTTFQSGSRTRPASWRIILQGTFSYLQSDFRVTAVNNPIVYSFGQFKGTNSAYAEGISRSPIVTNRTSSIPSTYQARFALTYRARASIPYDTSGGVRWLDYTFPARTHSFIRHSRMQ